MNKKLRGKKVYINVCILHVFSRNGYIFWAIFKIETIFEISKLVRFWKGHRVFLVTSRGSTMPDFLSLVKTWDLAKKSHNCLFLSNQLTYANFDHVMMFCIENRTFEQILDFSISGMYRFCPRPTVKLIERMYLFSRRFYHIWT